MPRENAYQKHAREGLKLLDLAKTYAEDGAPATAAERAYEAYESFSKAAKARNELLEAMQNRQPVTITKVKGGFNVQHNIDPLTGKPRRAGV
jgi:hypothetical protein